MSRSDADKEEYFLLRNSCGRVAAQAAVLRMKGNDSLDLLQRISTNDLVGLKLPEHRTTVLTNEKGRMIDVVTVLGTEDGLTLVSFDGNSTRLKEWIEHFVVMEEVSITDISSDFVSWIILGPQAKSAVEKGLPSESANEWRYLNLHDGFVLQLALWPSQAFAFVLPRSIAGSDKSLAFLDNIPVLSQETCELFRIENGVPRVGREISELANPLEANLGIFVSERKGCYVGQEVIARLLTYNKVQRGLRGVVVNSAGKEIDGQGELIAAGQPVGFTTSLAYSYIRNATIGLAYLKVNELTSSLEFKNEGSRLTLKAEAVDLPFLKVE